MLSLVSGFNAHMSRIMVFSGKRTSTVRTRVRSVGGMAGTQMSLQIMCSSEMVVALRTWERFLARVTHNVAFDVVQLLEGFAAAWERTDDRVVGQFGHGCRIAQERFPVHIGLGGCFCLFTVCILFGAFLGTRGGLLS